MDSSAEKQKGPSSWLMKTQFLKPFVTSIDGPVAELPRNRLSVSSSDLKDSFSRVSLSGFLSGSPNFKSWAKRMEALHEFTWKKAGIFEAIKASTYKIHKNQSLILTLVHRWCPETKSFVFPWGEATITLEDVMVLLGFSVLGSPVFADLESSEMRDSVEKLENVRVECMNTASNVSKEEWILRFINRDDQMEHEAFLVMWLSHFVFPDSSRRSISSNVLSIAVRLARGERIALAPAVLACLYRDLGRIQAFARGYSRQTVVLKSLFKLVQVWTWERFRKTRPEANKIQKGEPRISQWSDLQQRDEENVSLDLDDFYWRPYTEPLENWHPPRFYVEKAMWMILDESTDDDFVSFARCLRVCQFVGIGFVAGYYPNRVAMQFGLSQDLPGLVTHHSNITEKEAWDDYNKPLDGLKLYIPSSLAATLVTARYQDWWLKSVSDGGDASSKVLPLGQVLHKSGKGLAAKRRRLRMRKSKISDWGGSTELPLSCMFQKELEKRKRELLGNKKPKRTRADDETSMDDKDDEEDNNLTIVQMIKSKKKIGGDASKSFGKRSRLGEDNKDDEEDNNITIAQMIKSREKTGGDASGSLGKRSRLEEDNNDSGLCQTLASEDETVAPQETEPRTEEKEQEETGSKAGEIIAVLIPSDENSFSDSPLGSNGGVNDIVMSPSKTKQICDDELHANKGSNAEKKTAVDVENNEPECLLKEDGEKQPCKEKLCSGAEEEEDNERLKRRKLAIEELASELEAPQEIEQRGEETGSKAEEIIPVLIPSEEINSSDPLLGSSEGVMDIVFSPPTTKQTCDDEAHVNKEKKTAIDVETKEPDCLLKEDGEKQRCNEKGNEDSNIDNERLKQRKLAMKELALKVEAGIMTAENTLAEIREWITKRNQTKTGVSA